MRVRILAACSILFIAPAAAAQNFDSQHKAWSVFSVEQDSNKICYITSSPSSKKGNYRRRGEPYLLVTYRSNNVTEVSISSGYPYKADSSVAVKIDNEHNFSLFTTSETPKIAWAQKSSDDALLVKMMRKGKYLAANGTSRLGTTSQDTYSLYGFTKALNRMKKLCK